MKDKFPIEGPVATVTKDMCDLNNHMNVVYYQHIFEDGCLGFFHDMGFTTEYFNEGYSSFTLETDIRYLKELLEGLIHMKDQIYKTNICFNFINV